MAILTVFLLKIKQLIRNLNYNILQVIFNIFVMYCNLLKIDRGMGEAINLLPSGWRYMDFLHLSYQHLYI